MYILNDPNNTPLRKQLEKGVIKNTSTEKFAQFIEKQQWQTPLSVKFQTFGLCKKYLYSELFCSVFSHIRTEYGVSLLIQSECPKMLTKITPNTGPKCSKKLNFEK